MHMNNGGLISRFKDFLPVSDSTKVISLHEGNTPLIKLLGPSEVTGCNIYGKAEY